MTVKAGVSILSLSPQALYGMYLAEPIFARLGFNLKITSIFRPGAEELLHAKGRAFDCGVLDFPKASWGILASEVKRILAPLGFDVILENPDNLPVPSQSKVAPHIHIEYDPKDAAGNKLLPV